MDKDIDNMSEKELLAELVRQGRRSERADMIKVGVLCVPDDHSVILRPFFDGLDKVHQVLHKRLSSE